MTVHVILQIYTVFFRKKLSQIYEILSEDFSGLKMCWWKNGKYIVLYSQNDRLLEMYIVKV